MIQYWLINSYINIIIGIVVPQKSSTEGQDDQKKKPIRYGSRVRSKKHRSNEGMFSSV